MTKLMWQTAKHEGVGNIVLEHVPIPEVGPGEVLTRTQVSLISRGSELWRRYDREDAIDPRIMGYSTSGVVEQVGDDVTEYVPGDRVTVSAPHAEYSIRSVKGPGHFGLFPLHPDLSFEEGTFHLLTSSSVAWAKAAGITPQDRVVVLGQGIVGNLVMQCAKRYQPAQLIAVDALDLRCRLAHEAGAQEVINVSVEEPVEAVMRLTRGKGASIVIDCVGGRAGINSFVQAQKMLSSGGLIQVIAKYQNAPLPLDIDNFQGKRVLASYPPEIDMNRMQIERDAMDALATGEVRVKPLITHHFKGQEAKRAFDFLHDHPDQALGILFHWV